MGANITLAGESLIAQKQGAKEVLRIARFIFANVPDLDTAGAVDRAAAKPAAGQIVYSYDIPDRNSGYVNPNQVVYSAQIGSDIGDWDFNWIGLESIEGVLFAVSYVPLQQKRRYIPPLQIGNNLTRNFLVEFDGAHALTGITIDASTWQHDFTVRLAGIDERERLSNRDVFGRACFFGSALQLEKAGTTYQLKPGTAYIEGIRLVQSAALPVVMPALPAQVWIDVVLQRELSDVVARFNVAFGANLADYIDAQGKQHYCVPVANVTAATLVDRRVVEPINGPLVQQFAFRTGDYAALRARATTKEDVGLGKLPNALSDDPTTNDSQILASTKSVMAALQRVQALELLDAAAGPLTHTLPESNAALGVRDITLRRTDVTINPLVIAAAGNDKLMLDTTAFANGQASTELLFAGDFLHLRSDGKGKWWCVGQAPLPASIASGLFVQAAAGSYTYIVPPVLRSGRRRANVTVIGGGGGGAYAYDMVTTGAGGGGYAFKPLDLTGVSSVAIVVGPGGPGSVPHMGNGANGGTSSFGAYISATGGQGGQYQPGVLPVGGKGVGGTLNVAGGMGSAGQTNGQGGAGGGNVMASTAPISASGVPGVWPGGGAGSRSQDGLPGLGADGMVKVEW
ncbi:hypothetical protein PSCICO_14950 [Pseudomonas cichorii]|uniref:phage tail-collar fiber domain-containing protein n=1 Tax=Pseudomonas cichorii TaxID=36746 RepID=UPI00191028FC|nr:phage tail protein [Pseudomonas cichorii]GFM86096.1 hypothetical protein PSCICO_14950 [Pseudomonas cichorii]